MGGKVDVSEAVREELSAGCVSDDVVRVGSKNLSNEPQWNGLWLGKQVSAVLTNGQWTYEVDYTLFPRRTFL